MRDWQDFGINPTLFGRTTGITRIACPQCSAHRSPRNQDEPDLSVHPQEGWWRCWHCGWSGNLKGGEWEEGASRQRAYGFPRLPPLTNLPESFVRWFEGRGIPERVLARNKIGHGVHWFPKPTRGVRPCLQFPYYRGDKLVNIKHRPLDKAFAMEQDCERIFFKLNDLAETTIIVEGEMDALSLEVAGFPNTVSVPDGAPAPDAKAYASKFDFLTADENRLAEVKRWIIAVDTDAPGRRLEAELARRLGAERCWRVVWPEGCKDANDVLVKLGWEQLKACIDQAKPFPIEGLIEISDISSEIDDYYDNGSPGGEHPGWNSLSNLYKVKRGEWTLVTGIPSHGKSSFLDALITNLIDSKGWRFGICSPENLPLKRHFASLAEKISGKRFFGPDRMSPEEKDWIKQFLADYVVFILPEEATLDAVLDRARAAVARRGIDALVVDPWNELDHARPSHLTETEYISMALTRFRKFARENGVHLWLVVHPKKLDKVKMKIDGQMREVYPVATPYDCHGSAHWRNKADNCLSIWRDVEGDRNLVQVHVQKVRFRENGKPGMAELLYDPASGRFNDTGVWSEWGQDRRSTMPTTAPDYPRESADREPDDSDQEAA